MKQNKSSAAAGIALTLISGILWGFSGSCGQYIFSHCGATSSWLVPIRLLISGIILLIFCTSKNKGKIFDVWKGKKNVTSMLLFTVFGLVMCQYSYFHAIELSNAGIATVLQYLSPAMILVFMCLKNKTLPIWQEAVSIILAIGGTFLIATGGSFSSFAISGKALIWGLLAAVFLVCYSLLPIPLFKVSDTPTVLGWGLTLGGIGL
ncbi:MAG: EamA family transporter, partial [Clostridia bacterium]|nr:EamA family transporter [Clostridia bacterium]